MNSSHRIFRQAGHWSRWFRLLELAILILVAPAAVAQLPENAPTPLLRHDPGGPDSVVKALQFAADGKTLYVAGWNKVVQVYRTDDPSRPFRYEPRLNFRVPVGPGRFGMI